MRQFPEQSTQLGEVGFKSFKYTYHSPGETWYNDALSTVSVSADGQE